MAKFTINTGSSPNDGTGDNLRTGATYINNNFNEIYNAIGNGTVLTAYLDLADDTSSTLRKNIGETLTFEGGLGIDTVITGGKVQIKVNSSVLTATASATLTNKNINLANNTITGTLTEFNTALTGTDFASTDQSQTLTNKSMSGVDNTFTAIPNTGLSNPGITIRDNTSTTDFVNLGETLSILGTGSVSSSVTGNTVTLNVSNLSNSDLSGSAGITNANLANSTVTIGNTAVALGSNISSAGNFNLTGTSSVSGSGTIDTTGSGSKVRGNFANQASFPTATSYSGLFALDETQLKPFVATQSGYINILTENDSVSRHADVFTTGIADGYILKWVSANGRFEAQANTGGSALTVADEGGDLSTAATKLDFVGSGVTASGTGATKTITISGGASALNDLSDVVNSSPTAGMSLVYNGTNWVQATTPVSQLLVTANGSSAFLFTGAGFPSTSGDNPALHLKKGNTYYFINNSGGSHPFRIQSTTGTGGTPYNTGVTNNAASSGAIIFHVSMDTPATLYYQCTAHGSMNGTINIT
jgi:hypothetical protein